VLRAWWGVLEADASLPVYLEDVGGD
jgi:hypothetical protein